jgi:small-conductance mechanosensitive channel/CRP-like cAMP-binding protein
VGLHPQIHFLWTLGFLAATALLLAVVRTRILRRRLLVAGASFLLSVLLHLAIVQDERLPQTVRLSAQGPAIEYLLSAFGVIAALVALTLNPWRRDRAGAGVPAIVQDAVVVLCSFGAALFFLQNSTFLVGVTGSAIILGLALQDTLGNAFAGLALQLERPFHVGHWVQAAGHEGRVIEVTWRATKIRTKAGNLAVLPNSEIAKAAITNYSEPSAPFRTEVHIGLGYETSPNDARDALTAAVGRVGRILASPPPEVLLSEFGPSSLNYTIWFWTEDFENYEIVQSQLRKALVYELRRRRIEIPYPIQIEYGRVDVPPDDVARVDHALQLVAQVPVFRGLPVEAQRALASATVERLFADGETIVGEGDSGSTMYLVRRGRVRVSVSPADQQVAVIEAGGYFGEMSLLTGDARTATVRAEGDSALLEIASADFGQYVRSQPSVLEQLAASAAERRRELEETRAASHTSPVERISLLQRMQRFFGISG